MIFNEYADQASSVKIEFASGESREAKLMRHDEHGVIVSDRTGVYYSMTSFAAPYEVGTKVRVVLNDRTIADAKIHNLNEVGITLAWETSFVMYPWHTIASVIVQR